MWRREDSDQSISDEDDYECDWPANCVSLAGISSRKEREGPGITSRLELLTGLQDGDQERKARHTQNAEFSSEDEVEIPIFNHDGYIDHAQKEENDRRSSTSAAVLHNSKMRNFGLHDPIILWPKASQNIDVPSVGYERNSGRSQQSTICTVTVNVLEKAKNLGSSLRHPVKGYREKGETKSSLCSQRHSKLLSTFSWRDEDLDSSSNTFLVERIANMEHPITEPEAINVLEDSQVEVTGESEQAFKIERGFQYDCEKHSIAELLDDLQGKNGGRKVISKRVGRRARRKRLPANENKPHLGDRVLNDDDPCGLLLDNDTSSDDEANAENLALRIVEAKRETVGEKKTIADQFEEALGVSSMINNAALVSGPNQVGSCCGGLLGRFQRVIQKEKELDGAFLKNMKAATNDKQHEARSMDVKILSRSFSGKLTICLCSLIENRKSSPWIGSSQQDSIHKTTTIIFNLRVCGDVELEVGRFIRIYHPWKEVQVLGCSEIITLASYFSCISA